MKKSFLYSHLGIPRNIDEFLEKVQNKRDKSIHLTVCGTLRENYEKMRTFEGVDIFLSCGKHSYNSSVGGSGPFPLSVSEETKNRLRYELKGIEVPLAEYIQQKGFVVAHEAFIQKYVNVKKSRFCDHDRKLIERLKSELINHYCSKI